MNLELKAKHFVDTYFSRPCSCAISKAATEVFGKTVYESVNKLEIKEQFVDEAEETYFHENYDHSMFCDDKEIADASTDPEKVIRTILLIKQEILN